MFFSRCMICYGGFVEVRHYYLFLLLVCFSLFMFSTSFLCSSSRVFSSLPVSPKYSTPQFLHGIWYASSLCSVNSTLSFGCIIKHLRVVGTHGCRNSILLHYSVYSFQDSLQIWNNHLTPVVFVLCFTVGLFLLFCVVCDPFQGPGWIVTYS